jgi:hypothetical protein
MLTEATQTLISAALNPESSLRDLEHATKGFLDDAATAPMGERNAALVTLAELIGMEDLRRARGIALLCGALVEGGCDPAPVGPALVDRLRGAFEDAATGNPRQGYAWQALDAFWRPAIAAISVSPEIRAAGRILREPAEKVAGQSDAGYWIKTMYSVLEDEPVMAIEPGTGLGIVGRISGVATNFQLNILMMDAFPLAHPNAPRRVSQAAAEVAKGSGPQQIAETVTGTWDLHTWKGADAGRTLRQGTDNWIWNEGTPSDIPLFEGRRVILLGPRSYLRGWQAARTFAKLPATLDVERAMTGEEIESCLNRMAAAAEV